MNTCMNSCPSSLLISTLTPRLLSLADADIYFFCMYLLPQPFIFKLSKLWQRQQRINVVSESQNFPKLTCSIPLSCAAFYLQVYIVFTKSWYIDCEWPLLFKTKKVCLKSKKPKRQLNVTVAKKSPVQLRGLTTLTSKLVPCCTERPMLRWFVWAQQHWCWTAR